MVPDSTVLNIIDPKVILNRLFWRSQSNREQNPNGYCRLFDSMIYPRGTQASIVEDRGVMGARFD
ncbi:MAG: hypothetical protein ACKO4S_13100 [Snowella sp.]